MDRSLRGGTSSVTGLEQYSRGGNAEAQEFLKSLMRNGLLHFEQAAAVLRMLEAAANLEQSERQAHC